MPINGLKLYSPLINLDSVLLFFCRIMQRYNVFGISAPANEACQLYLSPRPNRIMQSNISFNSLISTGILSIYQPLLLCHTRMAINTDSSSRQYAVLLTCIITPIVSSLFVAVRIWTRVFISGSLGWDDRRQNHHNLSHG